MRQHAACDDLDEDEDEDGGVCWGKGSELHQPLWPSAEAFHHMKVKAFDRETDQVILEDEKGGLTPCLYREALAYQQTAAVLDRAWKKAIKSPAHRAYWLG